MRDEIEPPADGTVVYGPTRSGAGGLALQPSSRSGIAARRGVGRAAGAGKVLDLVRRGEATTVGALSAALGMARSSVNERLDTLFHLGLILHSGETSPSRGRPANKLAFNPAAGVTLVAQVGMSGSFLAVTDLRAEVLWVRQIQQDVALGPEALFRTLRRGFIEGLEELGKAHTKVYGIGIGLPGDIEIATARTTATSAMHDWADFPLTNRLEEAFGAPAFVDRDVNLMAVGERSTSWPDADVFICLKVGTVIACGVVVGDQVIRGVGGLAGEVGHTKLQSNSLACACGSVGCLNTVAGGAALAEQLQKMGHPAKTARDVTILANSGIAEAGSAVRTAGTQVGEVMALLVNVLNPAVITVWGYLVDAGDQFLAGMEESIYRYALPASARAVTITRVRLGDQAGLRGAALAVIEKAFDISSMDKLVAAQR